MCSFMLQSHDQEETIWRGGQLTAGSGECARTFPQVYGHTSDQTAFREVTGSHMVVDLSSWGF